MRRLVSCNARRIAGDDRGVSPGPWRPKRMPAHLSKCAASLASALLLSVCRAVPRMCYTDRKMSLRPSHSAVSERAGSQPAQSELQKQQRNEMAKVESCWPLRLGPAECMGVEVMLGSKSKTVAS